MISHVSAFAASLGVDVEIAVPSDVSVGTQGNVKRVAAIYD